MAVVIFCHRRFGNVQPLINVFFSFSVEKLRFDASVIVP